MQPKDKPAISISNKMIALSAKFGLVRRTKGCFVNLTRIAFTIILLFLLAGNALSIIKIDTNTILLILIIVLIWFTPTLVRYFENIQISREGDKLSVNLSFAKLQAIEKRAQNAELLQTPQLSEIEKFVAISKINPNAALITLRTDIEHKLILLVEASHLSYPVKTRRQPLMLRGALDILVEAQILTKPEANVFRELSETLNHIVHSADVSSEVIRWAVDTGPFLLTSLDKKLADLQTQNNSNPKAN